jgi:hypothetical protein
MAAAMEDLKLPPGQVRGRLQVSLSIEPRYGEAAAGKARVRASGPLGQKTGDQDGSDEHYPGDCSCLDGKQVAHA